MRAAVVMLPVLLLLSVGLMGLTKVRKIQLDTETKYRKFREIKMQVNIDLLEEAIKKIAETQKLLEGNQSEFKSLTEKYNILTARAEQAKINYEDCSGDQKLFVDQIGETQTEFSTLKSTFAEERNLWMNETDKLKNQLKGQSLVCNYLKPGITDGRLKCGGVRVAANQKQKKPEMNAAELVKQVL